MTTKEKPNYYAILTADVRYSKKINANEKLLFAEITALSSSSGICWASNGYFSELFNCTPQAISKWIKNLENSGFISVKYIHKNGSKEIERREISCINVHLTGINHDTKGINNGIKGINHGLGGYQHTIKDNTINNNNINNNNKEEEESDFVVFNGFTFPATHIAHSKSFMDGKITLETFMLQNSIKTIDGVKSLLMEFNKHLNIDGKYYDGLKFKDYRQHFVNWYRRISAERGNSLKSNKNGQKLPDGVQPAEWLS